MVGYICGHEFGMSNNVTLMVGIMVLVGLGHNSTIVSWWCLIG